MRKPHVETREKEKVEEVAIRRTGGKIDREIERMKTNGVALRKIGTRR